MNASFITRVLPVITFATPALILILLFPHLHWLWIAVAAAPITLLICWALRHYLPRKTAKKLIRGVQDYSRNHRSEAPDNACDTDINQLTHEFNSIAEEIDSLRERIEKISAEAQKTVNHQTEALNNVIRQLRREANADSMTGLANRRHFGQYSLHLFEEAHRRDKDLACIMIDIDHFKIINDQYGHATGDAVIVLVGELVKASIRQGDLCARYGGDEFVILLQGCSSAQAQGIGERLRREFLENASQIVQDTLLQSKPGFAALNSDKTSTLPCIKGLSVGIATLKQNEPTSMEQLIRMADMALYHAKKSGRNCVVIS